MTRSAWLALGLVVTAACGGGGGNAGIDAPSSHEDAPPTGDAPSFPTLASIAITPNAPALAIGATQQLTATGTFQDSTTQDLTAFVTWASDDTLVATVSTAGLVSATGAGSADLTATIGTISGSAVVAVTSSSSPLALLAAPINGVNGVRASSPITLSFDQPIAPATLTAIASGSACTGSVQLSPDGFASCIPFSAAAPAMDTTNTIATFTPAAPLGVLATYKLRVLGTVAAAAGGTTLGATYSQSAGFMTATDAACGAGLLISQVFGGGGESGAALAQDFIELHNAGATTVNLSGLSLQYAASAATAWSVVVLPPASVAPGAYYLVGAHLGATGTALPTPDTTAATLDLSATGGKLALVDGTAPLTGACPLATTLDLVGWGSDATCAEGSDAPATTVTASVVRAGAGCTDANANSSDFTAVTAMPRNSGSAGPMCTCTATAGSVAELDYCNLQFPATLDVAAGGDSGTIYARVYEAGVTEGSGADPRIAMQLGFGASMSDPSVAVWTWSPTTYNVQVGNDDEYMGSFTVPATTGTYSYTSRGTRDGTNWTYCDLDGNGANDGLAFSTSQLGALTDH